MQFLADLWLPILVSAVLVFTVSSILHVAIPLHKGDYGKVPGEAGVLEAMRGQNVTPGTYMFPFAESMKDTTTPEMKAKYEQGPVGFMTVLPNGAPALGKSLVQWFVMSVLVGILVAYVASRALEPGAEYLAVFRMCGAVAVIAYALGHLEDSIWKAQRWGVTFKFLFGGVLYGLVTAGTFAWMWPAAPAA